MEKFAAQNDPKEKPAKREKTPVGDKKPNPDRKIDDPDVDDENQAND